MLRQLLSSPAKLAVAVFIAALTFHVAAGLDIGADALDSDTLSLVLQWKLIRDGVVLDDWVLSTPKFLPVVIDGVLYEFGADGAVLARSLVTSALLVGLAAAFTHLTLGWQASLTAAILLLLNRTTFGSAYGGNSTILYSAFLVAAPACFLKWPSRRAVIAGLLLLFGASLTRIEGLSYLGLAGIVIFAASWKRERRFAFLTAGMTVGLVVVVFAVDLWVPSTLSGRLRSARSVALELNSRAMKIAEAREGEDLYAQAVARIDDGYFKAATHHLSRIIRPIFLLAPLGLAGLFLLWKRKPLAVFLLVSLGTAPLFYCAVLHIQGVALFDRFFLPTAVAVIIAVSFTFQEALARLRVLPSRRVAWVGLAAVLLLFMGLLGIGARDVYYHKQGYLNWRATSLRQYAAGLSQLRDSGLADKRLLVYAWHHAYTNLVLGTHAPSVSHDYEALVLGPPGDRLSKFDYLLYGKGDSDVDRLFGDVVCRGDHCTLETPGARFETLWISPGREFLFFKKTS